MEELNLKIVKTPMKNANELELFIEAPSTISDKAYIQALKHVGENLNVPGFRKGKVPKEIIEKNAGVGYISQRAFESIFYEILVNAALQEKLDIVDVVEISSYELLPNKPLSFKAVVELRPEIKLGKYKGLKVKAKKVSYDKDIFVNKTLERIANNLVTFKKATNRSVKEGDQVVISFEGKFEDGTLVPGGKAENFQALLDKDKFLPEFVDKLQRVKIGETKEITVTFPDKYAEGFSGKKAVFKVIVSDIEEKVIPEINDELAKKVGIENLEALKLKIEEQMLEHEENNSKVEFENKIVDEIIANSKFNVSERMTNKEIDYLLNDIKEQCKKKGVKWADFKRDEKNKQLFTKAKETAKRRIAVDLVLAAIIKKESISVPPEELDNEVKNRILQLDEKYKYLENDNRFRSNVELVILRNKTIDFLTKNNEVVWEKEISKVIPG